MSVASEYGKAIKPERPWWKPKNGISWVEVGDDGRARFYVSSLDADDAIALARWLLATFGETPMEVPAVPRAWSPQPAEDGYYWFRETTPPEFEHPPILVEVQGHAMCHFGVDGSTRIDAVAGAWWGPLEPPA